MRFLIIAILGIGGLSAHPKNPIVREGKADFEWGERLVVEVKDRTVIDWTDFSVEELETVHFILPSSQSTVLNRVAGGDPSLLLGRIESNGCVMIMNRAGILIGEKGTIDMQAFYATSLDVLDPILWQRGELRAKERARGMIVNQGVIRTADLCFLGYEVQNHGAIKAENVAIVGAREAIVFQDPFRVQTANLSTNIYEDLWPSSHEDLPYSSPVLFVCPLNMPGPTVIEDGAIRSSSIVLLADYIEVKRRSILDASGENGGSIWIGGGCGLSDWRGARIVRIDGTLKADGRRAGNILACSEGAIRFYGSISARGIDNEGSIGLLGKVYIDCKGAVDSLYFEEKNTDNLDHEN